MITAKDVRDRAAYKKTFEYRVARYLDVIEKVIKEAVENSRSHAYIEISKDEDDEAREVFKILGSRGFLVYPRPRVCTKTLSATTGNYRLVHVRNAVAIYWDEFDKDPFTDVMERILSRKEELLKDANNPYNLHIKEEYKEIGEHYGLLDNEGRLG